MQSFRGLNATSGFGMINGGAPEDLADAQTRVALGVWGTGINDSPDPYYWNYFYNFYAQANGLALSDDALINTNVAASPVGADNNLVEEYGNVSVSLYTRPDILIGCASTNGGSDTDGYNDQLATIHSFTPDSPYYQQGDETYDPQLVSYQTTYIKQMIESVYRIADAVAEVEAATGKTTRYGNAQQIAADYEAYVYGVIAYVQEELAAKGLGEKTVAVVTAINEDGTYTLADSLSTSATSLVRAYEYCMCVSQSLVDVIGSTTATLDQLLTADAIVTINNQNITQAALLESFGDQVYDGFVLSNTPAALYGMTMNSVENAMGYAFVIGSLYSDVIDINPVELCAYFYNHFLHVSDLEAVQQIVMTNFADTILPAGISTTLPGDFSAAKIEALLDKGAAYYAANTGAFQTDEYELIGMEAWTPAADQEILTIYAQVGDGKADLVKTYSADDLAALADTKDDGYGYVYYKGDATNAVVATEYVALDALLADAGLSYGPGDKLAFTCDDGPYTKGDFTYETVSARGLDVDGNPVPTAVAIAWNSGNLADGTVAEIAAGAYDSGSLRFVSGATAEELESQSAAGNRMPSGIVSITVVSPLTVVPTNQTLTVNGEVRETEIYNINGSNYFKLRDMAALLNGTGSQFSVSYDAATQTIAVVTGEAYEAVGGELELGTDKSATCVASPQSITVNGQALALTAYNIGGNNFFKLRELGEALNFSVEYDEATRTMVVASN